RGLGGAMRFVRRAALGAERGAGVGLMCYKPLLRLFRDVPGVDRVFEFGDLAPPFDLESPLMSVPYAIGTTLDSIPAETPYLAAEPKAVRAWGERLSGIRWPEVGLAWSGDPRPDDRAANLTDARRSLRLAQLGPLAAASRVQFFSLQKGAPATQMKEPPQGLEILDFTNELNDFMDTAALVANLDLVIGVDTSVIHLAGALGVPTWVLSRYDGCWRWMLDRDDTPWYPRMRIFRQEQPA